MPEAEIMASSERVNPLLGEERREISRDGLKEYIEGCEEIAVRLHGTIEKVIEQGKRPVILIPSRGAVPIFLLARRILQEFEGNDSFLSDDNARYYPEGIFDYLEGKEPKKNPDTPGKVDIILFPFTADVSLEGVKGDERLAHLIRESCSRAVLTLIEGTNYRTKDLSWYKFLMSKLRENNDDEALKANSVVDSLTSYPRPDLPQIILVDTVISGRAANDITEAFVALGHPVTPLLAVDTSKGIRFHQRRKAEIDRTVPWGFRDEKGPFVEFPLITEDKGAALLGVVAVNFLNFNQEGIFHEVNRIFHEGYTPQSCIWTLTPKPLRERYLSNFRRFLDLAWRNRNERSRAQISDEEFKRLRDESFELTSKHPTPSPVELNPLIQLPSQTRVKETSSHIISIELPKSVAIQWIGEFSQERNQASSGK